MFSKKLFIFSLVFCFPMASYAKESFFSQFTCYKIIRDYSLPLINGELEWQKQDEFFHCLHDFLELVVEKGIFTHSAQPDHFTRQDIFNLFNYRFGYDVRTSRILTNRMFFIKKALLGGSINKIEDRKVAEFYRLVYDYQEIYFILYKQIPVFQKFFFGSVRLTPEESRKTLDQLRKAFTLLERAYIREKIAYRIDDLHKYDRYFTKAQLVEQVSTESTRQKSWFVHNLFAGLFYPLRVIQGRNWRMALKALYDMINLSFYHKTYFSEELSSEELIYRVLESLDIVLSSIQLAEGRPTGQEKGFPLKNLDEMLMAILSSFNLDSRAFSTTSLFSKATLSQSIPLFTRTLSCFSLDTSTEKNCKSQWGAGSSPAVVTLSFPDVKFELFSNKIKKISIPPNKVTFIEMNKLKIVQQWLADYKKSLVDIHYGTVKPVAERRQFNHWLNPFFGWEKEHSRITFGSFHFLEDSDKFQQLLNYQVFLPLLFFSYLPENFFSPEEDKQSSLSFKTWARMVNEISPALIALKGNGGYEPSWRKSFLNLFDFADSFLHSSNRDKLLNARELTDLTIHLMEGIKNSRFAYSKIHNLCHGELNFSCAAEKMIEDQEILAAYLRLQIHFKTSKRDNYKKQIETILEEGTESIHEFSFVPLFILLQVMELNYNLINTNQSFYLESDEILAFIKNFEDQLALQIPYLPDSIHARAWLMYIFKTGDIPFFTGDMINTPTDFAYWYFNSKNHEPFQVSPGDFHFVVLDFYKLYQRN